MTFHDIRLALRSLCPCSVRVTALSDREEACTGRRNHGGRLFRKDDDRPGAEPVVMLSGEVWQRRCHGDPGVVGRSIHINGKPDTVVGAMPPRFSFPETQKVWIPGGPETAEDKRDARYLFPFARLNPSVDLAVARAELASIREVG